MRFFVKDFSIAQIHAEKEKKKKNHEDSESRRNRLSHADKKYAVSWKMSFR